MSASRKTNKRQMYMIVGIVTFCVVVGIAGIVSLAMVIVNSPL